MPAFDLKHTEDLKAWLIKELEPICDADPEVLSDYVLALLKHDASEGDHSAMLAEQLEDFLAEQTQPFVSKTLDALKTQEFLPQSKRASSSAQGADLLDGTAPSASRKRAADDEGRESPAKTARDSERRSSAGPGRQHEERGARRDGQQRQKPMCRDFHQRGFCARGDACKFDHTLPAGPSAAGHPNTMMGMPVQQPNFGGPGNQYGMMPMGAPAWNGQHGYPHQMGSGIGPGPSNGQVQNGDGPDLASRLGGQVPMQQAEMPFAQPGPDFGAADGSGSRGGRGGGRGGRGGARGTFERRPTSNTTLVIENVPQENLDLIQVNEYFKKFGTITNIQIDAPSKKALVSFSQPGEAKAAHASPEVIFNNRFVKVYFQKLDEPLSKPQPTSAVPAPALRPTAQPFKSNFVPGQNKFVRPELAQEKAKEAQASIDAAQKRLDDLMTEQKELMTKLTSGSASAEDKRTMMTRFSTLETDIKKATEEVRAAVTASKEGTKQAALSTSQPPADSAAWREQREKKEREQLDRELEAHSKGGETSDELRAKLAKLEAEANELGINAADVMAGTTSRGAFRGARGGRGFRGSAARGGFNTYYRGRGSAMVPSRASMSLDNRTSKVLVSGVPEGGADKTRDYFKQFGDVDDIAQQDDGTLIVAYKARASGERALRSGLSIPDVGTVKATWSTEGSGSAGTSGSATASLSTDAAAAENGESAIDGQDPDAEDGADELEGDDREDHFRRGGS